MKRKKRTRQAGMFNPLAAYFDMIQASAHATELFTSSAKVIAHRSELMSRAAGGDLTVDPNEFITMWMEKVAASNEFWVVAMRQLGRTNPSASVFKDLMQTMAPFRTRASANAKRLGRK